jgi:hypothetical protein
MANIFSRQNSLAQIPPPPTPQVTSGLYTVIIDPYETEHVQISAVSTGLSEVREDPDSILMTFER